MQSNQCQTRLSEIPLTRTVKKNIEAESIICVRINPTNKSSIAMVTDQATEPTSSLITSDCMSKLKGDNDTVILRSYKVNAK